MRRHRERTGPQIISKPDVTPLMDLTFLLLIVFMITAPTLEYSLDISPPEFNAHKIEELDHKIISLDQNGAIHLEEVKVSKMSLISVISRMTDYNKDLKIFIRADKSRPYGEVMDIMKIVRQAGIVDVALVTIAEEK